MLTHPAGAEYLGHHTDCETDSLNALKVFSENLDQFDLAIIEPMLPDLAGLDLANRFRHIRPDFPVMFYAGYVDQSLSRRIEAGHFGRVSSEPFILRELTAAIRDRLSSVMLCRKRPPGSTALRPFLKTKYWIGQQAEPFPEALHCGSHSGTPLGRKRAVRRRREGEEVLR